MLTKVFNDLRLLLTLTAARSETWDSMAIRELFDGVYSIDGRLATRNMAMGTRVYGEDLVELDGVEYRMWNPYRSKLSAAILLGLKGFSMRSGSTVLYLGAATGTTASHVSDVVGPNGRVYCVELSARNMRELIRVCESRKNMLPILGDARRVDAYADAVGACDFIYQDVAARDQASILMANAGMLKRGGTAYFIIKSQSISIAKRPSDVFDDELARLSGTFEVVQRMGLEPFDSMHLFTVLRKTV